MGGQVLSLAITSDGLFISGSDDNTIKVWGKEFQLLKTLSKEEGGHSSCVRTLGITSDGLLISGS
jgi:WD40 repeat protein